MFTRQTSGKTAGISLIGWTVALVALLAGQAAADKPDWATGPALQRQLDEPVDIFWSSNPLRRAFDGISKARQTAILIDRRVDPGRELSVSLKGVPLVSALKRIAADQGLELSRIDNILYLGSAASAERLAALRAELAADIRQLPRESQRKLFARKAVVWPDHSEPRDLIDRLAREGGVKIERLELMPHDLWAAADLPSLTLADRLMLIAFQFDLALKPLGNGRELRLVPLTVATSDQSAAKPDSRPTPGTSDKSANEQPGDIELLRIERLVIREKPLGAVLDQLAKRLGLDLRFDREAIAKSGVSLDQRVSVKVENATIDQLFDKLLADTGLTYKRNRRVVEITLEKPR